MAVKLNKPILMGGLGASFGLWLLLNVKESVFQVGEYGLLATMVLGGGFWLLKSRSPAKLPWEAAIAPMTKERVEGAIAQAKTVLAAVQTEVPERDLTQLQQTLANLPERLNRKALQLAVTGGKNTGKTALTQLLSAPESEETWIETEPFLVSTEATDAAAKVTALTSDLAIFVVAGDLTDSELKILKQLRGENQRLLLAFNKQDRFLPEERVEILQQLRQRVFGLIPADDVIAIAAAPSEMKVRQHQADGSQQEWMEAQEPEISALRDRLSAILTAEREQLVWATAWREAMQLKAEAKAILNAARRDRAMPIIEQYQWIAAAAAFANPVAALDLLAAAAISGQMLVDLSAIYPQKFSLAQAQTVSSTIGQLMVKLGIVELSTQAIGSILKSNAMTYVAGGAVQGVSAAYLTRLAGLSAIEYFQEVELSAATGEEFNRDRFSKILQAIFQQNQRTAFLQDFVKSSLARLAPESKTAEAVSS
ncbi:DUF697 domain-containing protein [Oscillatoria sp. FACHB-1406]|nr:DUF697 domain-containing protein [Oscillatoria sp. FACHB-1406]MBD2577750.1 DUF697 domain-containing protein [Oscillatoria sp. FACHB-1406]